MEKTHVIPLKDAFKASDRRRASAAARIVKEYLEKKLKLPGAKVDASISKALWKNGGGNPPRSIKVKVAKEGDKMLATLAE